MIVKNSFTLMVQMYYLLVKKINCGNISCFIKKALFFYVRFLYQEENKLGDGEAIFIFFYFSVCADLV